MPKHQRQVPQQQQRQQRQRQASRYLISIFCRTLNLVYLINSNPMHVALSHASKTQNRTPTAWDPIPCRSHVDPMHKLCMGSTPVRMRIYNMLVCYFFASAVPRCRCSTAKKKKKYLQEINATSLIEEIVLRVASTPVLPRV